MWSSPIIFERPWVLLLLLPALSFVWLLGDRSHAEINVITRRQVTWIRLAVVFLVVLAAAGVTWRKLTDRLTTMYVVDVSRSISPEQRQDTLRFIKESLRDVNSHDTVGLVVFGKEPFVEFPPSSTLDTSMVRNQVSGESTDIQSGLDAAAGAMPNDGGKRIVLCSDGLENSGSAEEAISALKSEGVQVDVAPTMLNRSNVPEALVDRLVTPSHVSLNEPVQIRAVLSSTVAQAATLTIKRDGVTIGNYSIKLAQGKSAYYFDDRIGSPGIHSYSAELDPRVDTHPENNIATSSVLVQGTPHVLILRNANEPIPSALPSALRAQGISVTLESPAESPDRASGLVGYDSVILSDVAASDLSADQMTGLQEANKTFGVGLGMIGGVNSFGAGGYAGTPIEEALPVKMTPKDRNRVPAADVVIVLDASGSMAAEEDGVEKVEIAARAALNLLAALQPKDRVAVLAVTETAEIVMPLVSPAQAATYVPAIKSVDAGGGGIDCRNGLEAAYELLQFSNASIKHVIICPDTTDSEQQEGCVALAASVYKDQKISTSCCGIGQWTDSDVPFQKALAASGHGQLFVANQAANLPQFFKRDVESVERKLFIEGVFTVQNKVGDPVVDDTGGYPKLLGYNLVDVKPGATSPMSLSGHNDALFAYWRHGLGKSFAFTSDDEAHWSKNWVGWDRYPSFWAHAVRWSLRGGEDQTFQTEVSDIEGIGHVVVDAFGAGGYSTNDHFRTSVSGPDGSLTDLDMSETAPGRYEATFKADSIGDYVLQVQNVDTGGHQTSTMTTPYSPEYADLRPDTELLARLASSTGGIMLTRPSQVFRRFPLLNLGSESLVNDALLLACLLFVVDVAWRRFGWRPGRKSVEVASDRIKTGAIVAAGSIKKTIRKERREILDLRVQSPTVKSDEALFLKSRTASRAELEDDDPFPFVATLPERKQQDTASGRPKENT